MNKEAEVYIGLAVDALEKVVKRLPESKETFIGDEILQDATLMRIQEAGEHLAQLRENFSEYYDQHQTDA